MMMGGDKSEVGVGNICELCQ